MKWLRLVYLELRHNLLITFVLVTLSAWTIEQIANLMTGQGSLNLLNQRGLLGLLATVTATIVVVLAYRVVVWVIQQRTRQLRPTIGSPPPVQRGLVLLFGRQATAKEAIQLHREKLEFIWFILTKETKAEFDKLPKHWWGAAIPIEEVVHDPYQPDATGQAVNDAIDHAEVHRLSADELICDITGGTKAMTVGAFAVCIQRKVKIQMVPGAFDQNRNPTKPLEPIEIITHSTGVG